MNEAELEGEEGRGHSPIPRFFTLFIANKTIPHWPEVHSIAERLSSQRTVIGGHQALDILHVATALQVKARQLLTVFFDCLAIVWSQAHI